MQEVSGMLIISILSVIVVAAVLLFSRYKHCSADKIIVVYGTGLGPSTARCIRGGGVFVWPLIQDYAVLSLEPMTTEIDLKDALSKKNIRIAVLSKFTFGISTNPKIMINAAERLLGLNKTDIINQASDIILGQLRLIIATLSIEEINQDRERFLDLINADVNTELNKIGLEVIGINIEEITEI